MTSPDRPGKGENTQVFEHDESGSQAAKRLRTALERSRHPMLIADDQRRWVTGNAAACDLLGIAREEIPWRTMDEFTPPDERKRLEEQWGAFLANGGAEGWYQLYVPDRGPVPVEFSATANVLPSRHLSVFIPPDETSAAFVKPPLAKRSDLGAGRGGGGWTVAAHRARARSHDAGCLRAAERRHSGASVSLPGDGQVPCSQRTEQAGGAYTRARCSDRAGDGTDQLGDLALR